LSSEHSAKEAPAPPSGRRTGKTGYGIDEPRAIVMLTAAGILAVVTGVLLSVYTAKSNPAAADTGLIAGPGVGFLILVVTAALYWSSKLGKTRELVKIVDNIPWGGGEVVLDLGCGRGLATTLSARKLPTGYTIGVDMWSKARVSGNDPLSVIANAASAKVEDRVTPVKGAPMSLPLADGSVDVILSGLAVHHLVPRKLREGLFVEMGRVLKEGGRIGILDAGNGIEYAHLLDKTGLRDIEMHRLRFSSFPPFHVVLARKPYKG